MRKPEAVHASHNRPAFRQDRTNQTSEITNDHTATCPHFSTVANSAGVFARIIHNSQNANAAVDVAVRKNSRFAHTWRFLHQYRKLIPPSVRHADAFMDQMIVMGLIALKVRRTPTSSRRNRAGTASADILVNVCRGGDLSFGVILR